MPVKYFCQCMEPSKDDPPDLPLSLSDLSCFHDLPDLYFCPTCRHIRCDRCIQRQISYRYCPHCLRTTSKNGAVTCSRSCFPCPKSCGSHLTVKSESVHEGDNFVGKQFTFECPNCHWKYQSSLITKPQSVASIVASIGSEHLEKDSLRFNQLVDYYTSVKDRVRQERKQVKKMKRLHTSRFVEEIKSVDLPASPSDTTATGSFPQLQTLRSKYEIRCKTCRKLLEIPPSTASSSKYKHTSNAIDYIPRISLMKGNQLNFVNPSAEPVHIRLISPNSDVVLPCIEFDVGCFDQNSDLRSLPTYIKSIPTSELTDATKLSRAELLSRPIVTADSASVDPIERGVNWCTVLVTMDKPTVILVEVKTKKDFEFKFWVRIEI